MKIAQWIAFFCCSVLFTNTQAVELESITVFGDSLSDTGNTAHLLKSIRQDENPAMLLEPFESFVKRKMSEDATKFHIPKFMVSLANKAVTEVFEYVLSPAIALTIQQLKSVSVIPEQPYWHYHFSNGRVWVEDLADIAQLDVNNKDEVNNLAFGGSWAVTNDKQLTIKNLIKHPVDTLQNAIKGKLLPPSLTLVVHAYLLRRGKANPNSTYFIFSGSNDYLNALTLLNQSNKVLNHYVDNVNHSIKHASQSLIKAGTKKLVLIGVPDLALTPRFRLSAHKENLSYIAKIHNKKLEHLATPSPIL